MVAILQKMSWEGLGVDAAGADALLFDKQGARRPLPALVRKRGAMAVQLALMEIELRGALNTPRAQGYPPRVFISYRRESKEHVAWTHKLARTIEDMGYVVFLDQDHILDEKEPWEAVAKFIANLARSDIFLSIVTKFYGQHTDSGPNEIREWIFEEYDRATRLIRFGLLDHIVLFKSWDKAPGGDRAINQSARILDMRANPDDHSQIERVLPRYAGARLSEPDLEELGDLTRQALEASRLRNVSLCAEMTRRAERFNGTNEQKLIGAALGFAVGDRVLAITLCQQILENKPALAPGLEAARLLWFVGEDREAFKHAARLANRRSLLQFDLHMMMAKILEAERHNLAAINHYKYLLAMGRVAEDSSDPQGFVIGRSLPPHTAAGLHDTVGALSWMEWDEAEAHKSWAAALQIDPTNAGVLANQRAAAAESSGPPRTLAYQWQTCSFCEARYPKEGFVCLFCGVLYRQQPERCVFCDMSAIAPTGAAKLPFCAVCRRPQMADDAAG